MATKINQPSIGLTSLLGTQAFGETPNLLSQQAAPVVELLPFLGQQLIRSQRVSAQKIGVGTGVSLTVPTNEAWIIIAAAGRVNYALADGAAAVEYELSLRVTSQSAASSPNTTVASRSFIIQELSPGLTVGRSVPWNPPRPFVLGPGSILSVFVDITSSIEDHNYNLEAIYYRLNV